MALTEMTIEFILAVFHGEQYLPALLKTLCAQQGAEFRLLCRDDDPAGQTATLLRGFAERAPFPVRLLPGGTRLGPAGNFQKLLSETTADLVFLLDQDDLLAPEKTVKMAQKMAEAEAMFGKHTPLLIHSDLQLIDKEGKILAKSLWQVQKLDAEQATSFAELLTQNRVTGCACCLNRALIDLAIPFTSEEIIMHDWFLALTAAAFGKVIAIPEPLTSYRLHEANTIGAKPLTVKQFFRTIAEGSSSLRERVEKTMRQARYFRNRFKDELSEENLELLDAFLSLPSLGLFQRIAVSRQKNFRKYPIIRQLAFWIFSK